MSNTGTACRERDALGRERLVEYTGPAEVPGVAALLAAISEQEVYDEELD